MEQLNDKEKEILQILDETKLGETVTMVNLIKETQYKASAISAAILKLLKLGYIEEVRKDKYTKVIPFIAT